MNTWNDFNDAEQQQEFEVIPKGTVTRLRMTIKPGGYDHPDFNWTGGYATQSLETGSVYLACEFVVLEGQFAKRKVFSNIGLYSPKGETWGQMGRSFIRAVLNSSRQINPKDMSPQAVAARRIQGFHELDGIEFVGRIDVEKDSKGEWRNIIKFAIEPGAPEYLPPSGHPAPQPSRATTANPASHPGAPAAKHAPANHKPSWAQ